MTTSAAAISRARAVAEVSVSVTMYSLCSVGMILLNKLMMTQYSLNYPWGILIMQNGGALTIVVLAKAAGFISYPSFSSSVVKQWLPLTLLFVLMLFTSMRSLEVMSVAAQTILKNLCVVCTALGDRFLYGKPQTLAIYFSLVLMLFGSYLSVKGDRWVTSHGLAWTFLNIIATVSYTLYMKAVLGAVSESIGRYGPVFYNNLLSLPLLLLMGYTEIGPFLTDCNEATMGCKVVVVISVLVSSAMTFSVFWCMSATSPTTMSVVGSLNKIPLTFLSMFLFHQFPSAIGYVGIVIALSSGLLYTHLNIQANRSKAPAQTESSGQDGKKETSVCEVVVRVDEDTRVIAKDD